MNKKALWLLLIGSLLMALPVSTRWFFTIPVDAADFIKGFGVALIIASAFKSKGFLAKR